MFVIKYTIFATMLASSEPNKHTGYSKELFIDLRECVESIEKQKDKLIPLQHGYTLRVLKLECEKKK